MARPNVTFKLNDKSLVGPAGESPNLKMIGAMLSTDSFSKALARAGETADGVMFIPNINDLYARLSSMVTRFSGGATFMAGVTLYSVGSSASSYINGTYTGTAFDGGQVGPVGGSGGGGYRGGRTAFKEEFWAMNNFLQYGAPLYVGFGGTAAVDGTEGASGFEALADFTLFDVIFQGISSDAGVANVVSVVEAKKAQDLPVFGVLNVPSNCFGSGAISSSTSLTAAPGYTFDDFHYCQVFGEKIHLGANNSDTNLITTILAPDVAGCIGRTDREYFPWYSPAGTKRGRILNVTRLARNLKAAEQDALYDQGINPVVTFPGEGTFLFGDKTTKGDISTLSRINVGRLFINLKKTLGTVARNTLFEQNNATTRASFVATCDAILKRVLTQNGISEYRIICDESNNPIEVVEQNQFFAEVLIKPLTSINFITITLTNVDLQSSING